jgi:glucan phosphorylase
MMQNSWKPKKKKENTMTSTNEIIPRKTVLVEDDRTGTSQETLRRAMLDNLFYAQGKFPKIATPYDYYMGLAYTVRDRLLHRWVNTVETWLHKGVKIVCYLSAEFLMGPQLGNNILNLELEDGVRHAVEASGQDLDQLLKQEDEPGLGNGGLGRLAACFLDSLATLEVPAIGFGLRYEHGMFHQEIHDGWQVEMTDNWLHLGNPWEIARPQTTFEVKLGGHTQRARDADGRERVSWIPDRVVKGIPHDSGISGYRVNTCNTLRLWKAEAVESFDFQAFNTGDYYGAVADKVVSENLSKVLYPNDEPIAGKQLRLEQQYFFVSCSLQNIIKENPAIDITPRTFIFGGKAAPGYHLAKQIIRLINGVAEVVNADSDVGGRLKVAFFPDFDVKSGQLIYPAADLSEQISMAGKESSGTGNMKFAMNGALTIGTLDGANIEIREEVGADNFFLFGLTADQVKDKKASGYTPGEYYESDEELRHAIDQIGSGIFSRGDSSLFADLLDALLQWDEYLVLADYRSYIECQDKVAQLYRDQEQWTRAAILNVARTGKFSSDRSIRDYCEKIWHAQAVPIELTPFVFK